MKLKDKVAIVTGGSRGIGRATAIELAKNGADVTVNYGKHGEEAAEVVREIEQLGRRALMFQGNVADRNRDQQMIDETVAAFGHVDILVANAASDVRKPFLELDAEDVEKTWAVSLWGVFHCCQARGPANGEAGQRREHRRGQLRACIPPVPQRNSL